MHKILIPTDYSSNAEKAIHFALKLAHAFDAEAECILVHAYSAPATVPVYGYNPPGPDLPPLDKEQDYLKQYLAEWKKLYPGINIRGTLQIGELLTVLTSLIEEEPDINLVIMGTKGAGGVEEILLGSNAARAAKNLPRPLLIIPEVAEFKVPERVVFATDFQKLGQLDMLNPLREIVREFNPHVLTVHVLDKGKSPDAENEAINRRLQAFFEGTKYSHYYLQDSNTIKAIDAFIVQHKADWLALVGKDRGFFESLFHRSVVRKIAFHTKIPLLILKRF